MYLLSENCVVLRTRTSLSVRGLIAPPRGQFFSVASRLPVTNRSPGTGTNAVDTWKQVVPAVKTVDSSNFEGALLEFSNLRAGAAVDKAGPATGLNNPAAVITVKFDDGKKEERVTFGRPSPGPDVFAARPDQPGALKVETGKFDDAVKKLDSIQ